MEILKYEFNSTEVDFEFGNESTVMVNATQVAKIFDREVSGFLKTEQTKSFIEAYCRAENIPSENEFSPLGKLIRVVSSGRNNGTWMDRVVAIKFAAWLNPDFEVWVYKTIDYILFNHYQMLESSLKNSAVRKLKIIVLEDELEADQRFRELEQLKMEEKQAAYQRSQMNRQQLELFQGTIQS
jgi:hypothetical protein